MTALFEHLSRRTIRPILYIGPFAYLAIMAIVLDRAAPQRLKLELFTIVLAIPFGIFVLAIFAWLVVRRRSQQKTRAFTLLRERHVYFFKKVKTDVASRIESSRANEQSLPRSSE